MADTYLKNMRLDNDRKADFRTENPRSAFSFLAVKIAVSGLIAQGGPFRGWLAEKKLILASLRYFLFAKPCRNPRQTGRKDTKK